MGMDRHLDNVSRTVFRTAGGCTWLLAAIWCAVPCTPVHKINAWYACSLIQTCVTLQKTYCDINSLMVPPHSLGQLEPTGLCSWRQAFFHTGKLLCVCRHQPCACTCLCCASHRACSPALLHSSCCLRRHNCLLLQLSLGATLLSNNAPFFPAEYMT